MKKFRVYGTAHMACVIEVEALNERGAIYEADQRPAADWELTTTNVQAPVRAESAETI
jgi:hypothetical protein